MGTLARVRACTHSTKKTNCDITRRTLFLMAGSTLVSTSASSAVAEDPSLARNSPTPYQRGQNLEYGLNSDGRIRSCDAAAQPNCVSTSSLSELYSPPWTVSRDNKKCGPSCMMEEFDDILHDMNPGASLISETKSKKGGLYRRYRIPSAFNYDMVEILIVAPSGDDSPIVTYRSQAGSIKYIWPITQPLSDFGAQRSRMSELRKRLGWQIMGGECDVLECFQE